MTASWTHVSQEEAYQAGYGHGYAIGYTSSRSPKLLRPEQIPPRFDVEHRREDYLHGWEKGYTFGMKARAMGRTL